MLKRCSTFLACLHIQLMWRRYEVVCIYGCMHAMPMCRGCSIGFDPIVRRWIKMVKDLIKSAPQWRFLIAIPGNSSKAFGMIGGIALTLRYNMNGYGTPAPPNYRNVITV